MLGNISQRTSTVGFRTNLMKLQHNTASVIILGAPQAVMVQIMLNNDVPETCIARRLINTKKALLA